MREVSKFYITGIYLLWEKFKTRKSKKCILPCYAYELVYQGKTGDKF